MTITGERVAYAMRLSVSGEGPGLPPGGEEALFGAFVRGTGSDERGGSGPGLTIARGFAEAMRVTLNARDADGRGASFVLRFPVPR